MGLSTVSLFKKIKFSDEKYIRLEGDLLRRYQQSLLTIMEDIVSVCEEENIYYSLSGGSALGAIRHKGFIPWDDDMDIFILGRQRELFLQSFEKKFGDRYWIHSAHTHGYGMAIGRIRKKGTILRGREDMDTEESGFFIDIFWIENAPDSKILRFIHGTMCMGVGLMLSCRNFYKNRILMREIMREHREVRTTFRIKIFLGFLISFLSLKKSTEITEAVYSLCKNNDTKFVTVPSGRKHYFGELFHRKDLTFTRKAEFEGYNWNVPVNVEKYLEIMYGDYMQIPNVEDRESHIILEIKFPDS
ncbi:LicD family protein [Streptococcus minor]|uniref:LicD family protein n=1 Tax=Streptococcus minor TaxID=229549 RepID=UPI00035E42F8|nr:LicD family protein [Streptococcus minor]